MKRGDFCLHHYYSTFLLYFQGERKKFPLFLHKFLRHTKSTSAEPKCFLLLKGIKKSINAFWRAPCHYLCLQVYYTTFGFDLQEFGEKFPLILMFFAYGVLNVVV